MNHRVPLGQKVLEEVEEDGVGDDGGPAEEEDGGDQGQEDVGATAPLVDGCVLAGHPVRNNK